MTWCTQNCEQIVCRCFTVDEAIPLFHRSSIEFRMMTSSNWNILRLTGHLCGEFTGPQWIPRTWQWRGALMFSLICVWISSWVNNGEAGDLGRNCAHYDVTVIGTVIIPLYREGRLSSAVRRRYKLWDGCHVLLKCLSFEELRKRRG